ncbi:MAG TPA: 8-amino-7-oxononanoate synthase [Pseudomonadales bacterium]|nr:8-amino-7-oxononanoate synthase [Pseudomonadales bacterium]
MTLDEALAPALAARRNKHLYRHRRILESAQGPEVLVDGRRCLNFCSNDYLGFANHPDIKRAFIEGANQYGVGSGASHLVIGHSRVHHQLEEALAAFCQRPRALVFSSGYQANMGVINALLGRHDFVFEDKLNHASLLDGGLISGASFQRFAHNDGHALAKQLTVASEKSLLARKLVAVDGVFSMDGDQAPVSDYAAICQRHGAWLMVDDAHGFGVLGAKGRGSLDVSGCNLDELPIYMATLGKALGTMGAFVAGSEVLIETLVQNARNYIYTTALPPAAAAATLTSLQLLEKEAWRRQHLQTLIQQFRDGVKDLPFDLMPSATAIQPLRIGSAESALALSEALWQRNILITAIRPPTVPEGSSRLRITLTAAHSRQQVQILLDALADLAEDLFKFKKE